MIATKESIAICAILPCVLTFILAIKLDEANAQETIEKAPIPTEIVPELSQIGEPSTITAAPSVDEWLEIKKDASAVEVSNILGMAGWDEDVTIAGFDTSSPDDTFSLYTRNIAAGVSDFWSSQKHQGKRVRWSLNQRRVRESCKLHGFPGRAAYHQQVKFVMKSSQACRQLSIHCAA